MPDVILPVLDERDALPWVLGRFPADYRPIVVDNGSTDGSADVARELGATVVGEPAKGFGAACWTGLQTATDDVICFMDCDASLDPQELPLVAGPVLDGRADLVLGSRKGSKGAWPIHARVANRYLARAVHKRTGAPMSDLGPMRAMRREGLLGLGMVDRRFGWPLEMVLRAGRADWRIEEVVVGYRPRIGKSKVTGTVGGTLRAVRDMRAQLDRFAA